MKYLVRSHDQRFISRKWARYTKKTRSAFVSIGACTIRWSNSVSVVFVFECISREVDRYRVLQTSSEQTSRFSGQTCNALPISVCFPVGECNGRDTADKAAFRAIHTWEIRPKFIGSIRCDFCHVCHESYERCSEISSSFRPLKFIPNSLLIVSTLLITSFVVFIISRRWDDCWRCRIPIVFQT